MADTAPLREFIRKQFLFDDEGRLEDEDPLFPDVIDSLGVMEVVSFVEMEYGVEVDEDELLVENFKTLSAMSALIDRKRDAA
jgi:acyl carrier protein